MIKRHDLVRTTKQWNNSNTPIQGVVTDIIPLRGEPFPLIELNDGEYRINGFWLEKVNNEWLEMC